MNLLKAAGLAGCAVLLAGCGQDVKNQDEKSFDFSVYSSTLGLSASVCGSSFYEDVHFTVTFAGTKSDEACVSRTFAQAGSYEAVISGRRGQVTLEKRISVTVMPGVAST